MSSYRVRIYRSSQVVDSLDLSFPVEVGRRDPQRNEPAPIALHRGTETAKLVVAEATVQEIARRWFRISAEEDDRVTIENLHPQMRVSISNEDPIAVGGKRHFENDVLIDIGWKMAIRVSPIRETASPSDEFRSLVTVTPIPGEDIASDQTMAIRQFAAPDAKEIAKLLQLALQVVQKAAGSDAFFQAAVVAAAQIVELDRAVLLLRRDTSKPDELENRNSAIAGWDSVAEHVREGLPAKSLGNVSRTIVQRVVKTATTVIHDPGNRTSSIASPGLENAHSLSRVCCATASPILNRDREVIGILYGDRWTDESALPTNRISDLEATLVEVLASAVAGGIARKAEERLRTTLSEFFSPKVASLLANNPELMDGQDAEISVLFCDVRGFSSVTEKLGPKKAIEWINDVMSELSQCVIDRDGVLVDYVGDEVMAMWGAPGAQPDHAIRALDAARAMMTAIETLRTRWANVLPSRFGAGIGVNTGPARVGNVGSRQKFKYGALGNTVNVGSRLQSATKQLGVDCIASGETVRAAMQAENCRRLAKLSVVGIDQAIDVYEVKNEPTDAWRDLSKNYELALADFEAQRFGEAARRIGELIQIHPGDRPSKKLLGRAVQELDEASESFSPTWNLTHK